MCTDGLLTNNSSCGKFLRIRRAPSDPWDLALHSALTPHEVGCTADRSQILHSIDFFTNRFCLGGVGGGFTNGHSGGQGAHQQLSLGSSAPAQHKVAAGTAAAMAMDEMRDVGALSPRTHRERKRARLGVDGTTSYSPSPSPFDRDAEEVGLLSFLGYV